MNRDISLYILGINRIKILIINPLLKNLNNRHHYKISNGLLVIMGFVLLLLETVLDPVCL